MCPTNPQRPWRTKELIERDLQVAEAGKHRVLQCNKILYTDRIRRLKKELAEVTA